MAPSGHLFLDSPLVGLFPFPVSSPNSLGGLLYLFPNKRLALRFLSQGLLLGPHQTRALYRYLEAEQLLHSPTRRGLLQGLSSFPEPPDSAGNLGEDVSACTGPTTSRQTPGMGRMFSLCIHCQGCEVGAQPCPQDQRSVQGRMRSVPPRNLSHRDWILPGRS